jgi:REP element-mobilizing transposase RayT
MARKPRLHIPGASYHVILRGNARDDIFFADEDRNRFYLLLQEGVERFGHRIHAFCLMTNHVHLAVQVGDVPLSKIMQNVSFRYTRWVNWRKNRTGHLFQGRHKAFLVDTDEYLLQLIRYIHLNPVRVGLTKLPVDYRWSSHLAYLGKEVLPWLATDWALSHFAPTNGKARQGFARFVADGIAEVHRPEFHGHGMTDSCCIGEDRFVEQALIKAENRPERQYSVRPCSIPTRFINTVTATLATCLILAFAAVAHSEVPINDGQSMSDICTSLFSCITASGKYIRICGEQDDSEPDTWSNIQYRYGPENGPPELVYPKDPSKGEPTLFFSHEERKGEYRVTVRFSNGGYTYRVYSTSRGEYEGGAGVTVSDSKGKLLSDISCNERPEIYIEDLRMALPCDRKNPHGVAACKKSPYRVK